MAGYFGTEQQQRLQAQAEASVGFINTTPGACQAGRFMASDDPDRLGWEQISSFLDRDGICGFRLISADKAAELRSYLMERNYRLDTWDVFLGDRSTALATSQMLLSQMLPDGLREMEKPTDPEGEYMRHIQALMDAAGVVPFSGSLLAGVLGRATTVAIGEANGTIVACAHVNLPHNRYSAHHRYAWGGLVAVTASQRGKGLGSYVNARMVASAFRDLDATHVYELVSATNIASRRMVDSCGRRPEPALVCGIATPNDGARFTR
jgi:RimJ/RimL family protein N-acetyltransferase